MASSDKQLTRKATIRVYINLLLTLAMIVFTIYTIVEGADPRTMWLWLWVIVLWFLGVPTEEETEAVKNIMKGKNND